jgi:hypothetical protein
LFTAEPLEVLPDGEVEEGEDYDDRRGFRTYEEAVAYAEELVKAYKKRGDDAWWDDATG